MNRSYKFLLRPTSRQHVALEQCLEAHRELYNAALQERRDAWKQSKTSISYGDQSLQLKEIRACRADMATWSFSSQQATLRKLNKAFEGFYRRVKAGNSPGYPRFKSRSRFRSVVWPKDGDGARWNPDTRRVYLQGIGHVKVNLHRNVAGRVKTIQVRREGRRWMLILCCDSFCATPLPPTGRKAGVDLGIADFATLSDGQHIENPRWTIAASVNLAAAQRRVARALAGSNNRWRRKETVSSLHRKIANQRRDFHHKMARQLVRAFDTIVVEDLKILNMSRRVRPRPDPEDPGRYLPNGASRKTGLNRSITDAGWGQFLSILRYEAEDAGRTLIEVDPRHTSDKCEQCGHTASENRASQATFACRCCGHTAHADEHAARNILRAGLALHAKSA